MFTVKHIIWNGGFETVYQAKEVRAKKHDQGAVPPGAPTPEMTLQFVAFDLPNGEVHMLEHGRVYVMNEAGKTVATYDFGYSPTPTATPGTQFNQINQTVPKAAINYL